MEISCARCGAATGAGARFCASCGAVLEAPPGGERKLVTLVFADLVGSTELVSGRDPEEIRALLDPFFELARSALAEHGGRVEKFIGDAVVAAFGVPRAHGDDPDRAVAAAVALVERLAGHETELTLRIGVETGEALIAPGAGDLSVTGEASHAAARLQQAAAPGEILVGDRAARACRNVRLGTPRAIAAKGFSEPLQAFPLAGIEQPEAAPTPFLGRGAELDSLRLAYLAAVRERRPRLSLIVGEAGAGKTRIGRELLAELAETDPRPTVLVGRNPPYGDGIAFWALAEILRAAAGAPQDATAEQVRLALATRLAALGATDADGTAELLATTLTGDDRTTGEAALRRAWRRLLGALAVEAPVVIAVDDAHWADEGFLDLLDDAVSLPDSPLMVVCTARPEIRQLRPRLGDGDGRNRLDLGPLTPAAAQELAATLVGDDLSLAREIAAASGGNPFFAEEIAHAIGDGELGREPQAMPDTVQSAIAARLDALTAGDKLVLQRASVLGDRFRVEALRELADEPPEPALAELERRALVEPLAGDEPGLYGFRHQLIREVAYTSLTRAERVRLHRAAADGVRGRAGGRYAELSEVIAFHLACAAGLDPAPELVWTAFVATREAAELALKRGAAARAQELLEQAAALAPDRVASAEARLEAAEVALSRVRGDLAFELLRGAGAEAERAGDGAVAADCYARAAEIATRMAGISGDIKMSEVQRLLGRARDLVPNPDPRLRALLRVDDAWVAWRAQDYSEMKPAADEALRLARAIDDLPVLSSALDAATASEWLQGAWERAVDHCRERVEALQPADQLTGRLAFERTDALNMLADSLIDAGALREGLHWADLNTAEFSSLAPQAADGVSLRPLYLLGEWDEAVRRGSELRDGWLAEGRPPIAYFSSNLACIAAIHGLRGDELEQAAWLRSAEQAADGSLHQLPSIRVRAAEVALHRGEFERAVELLEPLDPNLKGSDLLLAKRAEALVLAGHPDASATVEASSARTTNEAVTRAVALRAQGLVEDSDEVLAEACAAFEHLECVYEVARTRWLRGGEHREPAAETFAGLGVTAPS